MSFEELKENDFNANIRRYADNAPPPEPQDVRAHLHGGVPLGELASSSSLLDAAGLDVSLLFADRGDGYASWVHDPAARDDVRSVICTAVATRRSSSGLSTWWAASVRPVLEALPATATLVGVRSNLVGAFVGAMEPAVLDRFEAAGIAATWWQDSLFDLKAAASRGWKAVLEGWLTTAEAGQGDKNAPDLADTLAIRVLVPDLLSDRSSLAASFTQLDAEVKAAESSSESSDEDDDDSAESSEEELSPAELKKLKLRRTEAKKQLKTLDDRLLASAKKRLAAMDSAESFSQAVDELFGRVEVMVDEHFTAIERRVGAWYDNLAGKYGTTLGELEAARDAAAARLAVHLKELGYG